MIPHDLTLCPESPVYFGPAVHSSTVIISSGFTEQVHPLPAKIGECSAPLSLIDDMIILYTKSVNPLSALHTGDNIYISVLLMIHYFQPHS